MIHHTITKLALALDPTEPTFSAAISPLDDLAKHINAITTCASLFTATFGSTLRTEVVGLTSDVLQATKGFIDHCVLITSSVTPPPKLKATRLYLTGSLHELIDNSRGADGLSKNNLQAIRKKWVQDRSVLEDGYRELSELLTSDETGDDSFNEDFSDEDDLVFDSTPLTPEETERVRKVRDLFSLLHPVKSSVIQVQRYIRITNLLHERIYLDLLKPSALKINSSLPNFTSTLDDISRQSARFVSTTDEVISCLHSPQDPKAISESLKNLGEVATTLQTLLSQCSFLPEPREQSLESQMESMTVQTSEAGRKTKDTRKWFDTCLTQIDKLQVLLSAEFDG